MRKRILKKVNLTREVEKIDNNHTRKRVVYGKLVHHMMKEYGLDWESAKKKLKDQQVETSIKREFNLINQ